MPSPPGKAYFERLYRERNRPEFIHPDPLEFVWKYRAPADREVVGFIAACLAYGNVRQILKSVGRVLAPMGKFPAGWLKRASEAEIKAATAGFKHRFTTGEEMAVFLVNIKLALEAAGSLENLFLRGYRPEEPTVEKALYRFIDAFNSRACARTLTPCTALKSSFKRVNLFLRWMARKDAVDPGVWENLPPAKLIIPLDTHMHAVSRRLGITLRRDTSMKTAAEITRFFSGISPSDPVKYDFAITREGIRKGV